MNDIRKYLNVISDLNGIIKETTRVVHTTPISKLDISLSLQEKNGEGFFLHVSIGKQSSNPPFIKYIGGDQHKALTIYREYSMKISSGNITTEEISVLLRNDYQYR